MDQDIIMTTSIPSAESFEAQSVGNEQNILETIFTEEDRIPRGLYLAY